ncbi:unnamed protein product [Ambrosiozyma monospora]|uniref:DNA helicase n=2 Tax=Ambrosiozyma monospora TaxID=43982 RepID=A0A9W6Z4P1_AMBMO|nr:unnamed protein product [Ambrosiozyma monospora]
MTEPNQQLASRFLDCLSVEKQEDSEQTSELLSTTSPKVLSSNGLAILNLCIMNIRTGIGGKLIVELTLHSSVSSSTSSTKSSSGKSKSKPKAKSKSKSKSNSRSSSFDASAIDTGDFRVGDIVKIDKYSATQAKTSSKLKNSSKKKDQDESEEIQVEVTGVVTSVSDRQINVAVSFDSTTQEGTQIDQKLHTLYESDFKIWLVQVSNEITYNRMESTMRKLAEQTVSSSTQITKLLLGECKYMAPSHITLSNQLKQLKFDNDNLNESQKNAINFSLLSDLSIIHGPPGTGKTSTVVELVKQLVLQNRNRAPSSESVSNEPRRILICGPSNISIDTILERLMPFFTGSDYSKLVRIGHPARMLPQIVKHSLDLIVESESSEVIGGILSDINKLTKKTKKAKSYKERREMYAEIKDLKKDLRFRSRKAIADALIKSEVVLATLHGSSAREIAHCVRDHGELFNTLIIDEVSQSMEPSCWIPLIYHQGIKKLIIAGDNKQLSPTIKTKQNSQVTKMLSTTLFDRLLEIHSNHDQFTCFLNIQYRMNEKIMRFPSDQLYHSKLVADESVASGQISDLDHIEPRKGHEDDVTEQVIWYDTQGGNFPESDSSSPEESINSKKKASRNALFASKYNDGECLLVLKHVKSLIHSGVKQQDVGIISPYNAQVTKLKKLIRNGILNDEEDGDDSSAAEVFPDIEISTVDGFQGREKEIIILSMVRSNDKHEVGFLEDFKRLNVSITRCKKQLCIVGDFETLSESGVQFLKSWCDWCEENADIRYADNEELY